MNPGGERRAPPLFNAMTTTVVLPTFNEAANVRAMAEALFGLPVPELRVLVVDDDSADGTARKRKCCGLRCWSRSSSGA